jgi:transcriptional regulator with XRE-family HTH domain
MTEQQARDFLAALGAEIAAWRRQKRLTRAELGRMVDVSETTVGRIERGGSGAAVATSDVWRIAAALGLSFSDLVRRAEDMAELSEAPSNLGAVASTETTIEPGDLEE